MTMQPSAREILTQVREGMDVYGPDNEKVGTVKQVYMGGGSDPAEMRRQEVETGTPTRGTDETFLGDLFSAFTPTEGMPDELRQRLERDGFIEIDSAGLFAGDRFATPDEIARVTGDRVVLSVSKNQLPKE